MPLGCLRAPLSAFNCLPDVFHLVSPTPRAFLIVISEQLLAGSAKTNHRLFKQRKLTGKLKTIAAANPPNTAKSTTALTTANMHPHSRTDNVCACCNVWDGDY